MRRWEQQDPHWLGQAVIVLVVASALALPALLWVLQSALGATMDARGGGSVVLFLHNDDAQTLSALSERLQASAGTTGVEALDASAARSAFAQFLGLRADDPALADAAIPATITVDLRADLEASAADALTASWRTWPGVSALWWDAAEQQRIVMLYRSLRTLGAGLTLVLLAAALAITAGSVAGRLARERPAIIVMTLLGASDSFILRPHLLQAVLLGVLAAAFAGLLLSLGHAALGTPLAAIQDALGVPVALPAIPLGLLLCLFLAAPGLAGLTTLITVRRQLRLLRAAKQ